jgi:hypothetical protein
MNNNEDVKTSLLQDITNAIKLAFAPKVEEVKLGSIKTADGAVTIEYEGETLTEGTPAFIMADDETKVPVPLGEHPLEDGRTIVVTEEGVVGEVKEAVTEEVVDEPMAEEAPVSDEAKKDAKIAEEISESIKSILIKYSELETKLEGLAKENADLKVLLSETPATKKMNAVATQVDLSKLTPLEKFRLNK